MPAKRATSLPLTGVHVSVSGGFCKALERAENLGCTAMQVFVGNPRGWKPLQPHPDDIAAYLEKQKRSPIEALIVHAIYLPNLASPDPALLKKSVACVANELKIADALHANAYVIHMGSAKGDPASKAIPRVARTVDQILDRAKPTSCIRLALETTAGRGFAEKGPLFDIFEVSDRIGNAGLTGVCLDTAHLLAGGEDFRTPGGTRNIVRRLRDRLDPGRLLAVHVNDSKGECGSHLDRHEHLGKGHIGKAGFKPFLTHPAIRKSPMILETPKKDDKDDKRNLRILRSVLLKQ